MNTIEYKKFTIIDHGNGDIETVNPSGNRFQVGLDDTKNHGNRISSPVTIQDAKNYIDWLIKNAFGTEISFTLDDIIQSKAYQNAHFIKQEQLRLPNMPTKIAGWIRLALAYGFEYVFSLDHMYEEKIDLIKELHTKI